MPRTALTDMAPPRICLVATGDRTWRELQLFLTSLEVWHPDAHVYVATDSGTYSPLRFSGTVTLVKTQDAYGRRGRAELEALPGKTYASLWTDFMYEKANIMEQAFAADTEKDGVWFCDADLVFLAPLPVLPETAQVALSPHAIRPIDEARYGRYNGGFFWMKTAALLDVWRAAGHTSRFYEQAALEAVAAAVGKSGLYEFPPSVNFGWWRMYQGTASHSEIQARFSIHRGDRSVGLRYDGAPLQSIHTHWYESTGVTGAFNAWFLGFACRFSGSHAPLARLARSIVASHE